MNEYTIEYFYRRGVNCDVSSIDMEISFAPDNQENLKKLEEHIKKLKKYDSVVISSIKNKKGVNQIG
jgi:hypothetical protein